MPGLDGILKALHTQETQNKDEASLSSVLSDVSHVLSTESFNPETQWRELVSGSPWRMQSLQALTLVSPEQFSLREVPNTALLSCLSLCLSTRLHFPRGWERVLCCVDSSVRSGESLMLPEGPGEVHGLRRSLLVSFFLRFSSKRIPIPFFLFLVHSSFHSSENSNPLTFLDISYQGPPQNWRLEKPSCYFPFQNLLSLAFIPFSGITNNTKK